MLAVMSIVGASIACIVCLKKPTRIVTTVACAAYVIMIVGMLIYGGTEAEFIAGEGYRKYYVISQVLLGLQAILVVFMEKKTQKGMMYEAQINGFKRYVKTAREEELKEMVEENPKAFFDILPYTYILGISKLWIKKFGNIEIEKPDWYTGNIMNGVALGSISTGVTERIQTAVTTVGTAVATSASSRGGRCIWWRIPEEDGVGSW